MLTRLFSWGVTNTVDHSSRQLPMSLAPLLLSALLLLPPISTIHLTIDYAAENTRPQSCSAPLRCIVPTERTSSAPQAVIATASLILASRAMVITAEGGGGDVTDRGVDLTSLLSLCLMTVAPILIGSTTATATIWENDTTAEEGDWSSANGTGDGSWLLSQNNLFVGVVLEAVAMPM